MASPSSPVPVHVEADVSLAEAGLTRAAERAGLRVVPAEEPALFTLRAMTLHPSEAGLDVFVGGEHIAIVVPRAPSRVAWNAMLPLVHELLAANTDRASSGDE